MMRGAIFYASKYGSTAQYAEWISQETNLPVFEIKEGNADPTKYDFLILGSPIIYYKPLIHKWVKKHVGELRNTPIIFFSVSGAPAGEKLNGWMADSLPKEFMSRIYHVALRGRQIPAELTWYDRIMMKIGAMTNKDPQARKEELKGFDYMDKSRIQPILELVGKFHQSEVLI
ncbi:MAG: flavodoxin domain-containing protein [Maribacter sp.]|uniref:flavodoxin domain-containing protein n=1 Tax=Maribacter sp. TaxID=1897614 RepID=UPI003C721059